VKASPWQDFESMFIVDYYLPAKVADIACLNLKINRDWAPDGLVQDDTAA